jgi:hypothetical protein
MGTSNRELRKLRQAAQSGNHSAARALLKLYGFYELAAQVKRGVPFSRRVAKMVGALTAGTGEGDEPGPWEHVNERGEIECIINRDPPPRPARPRVFDEDI